MQTEKRHPIAHALHIIGTGRTTLNNYIYGPGAILSAIFGEAGESLEDHIGPNRAPVCENQRWLRRYLTDEAVVVLSIGFRLIRYGVTLLSTQTADGAQQMILQRNGTDWTIAGYKAAFSNLVPATGTKGTGTDLSTLIFGNWSDLLIGQWGGIDIVVDDVTEAAKGNVRIIAHSEWDIAVRHAQSFAVITDAVTVAD